MTRTEPDFWSILAETTVGGRRAMLVRPRHEWYYYLFLDVTDRSARLRWWNENGSGIFTRDMMDVYLSDIDSTVQFWWGFTKPPLLGDGFNGCSDYLYAYVYSSPTSSGERMRDELRYGFSGNGIIDRLDSMAEDALRGLTRFFETIDMAPVPLINVDMGEMQA